MPLVTRPRADRDLNHVGGGPVGEGFTKTKTRGRAGLRRSPGSPRRHQVCCFAVEGHDPAPPFQTIAHREVLMDPELDPRTREFYRQAILIARRSDAPFLVAGAYAM